MILNPALTGRLQQPAPSRVGLYGRSLPTQAHRDNGLFTTRFGRSPVLGMGPEQIPGFTTAAIAPRFRVWGDYFLMICLG